MRKEKFSYLILLAEVIAIVWLHSVKEPAHHDIDDTPLAKKASRKHSPQPSANYIQTTFPVR